MGETVAVIGAGVIGGAIVRRLLRSEDSYRVIATRRKVERIKDLEGLGAEITTDNAEAARMADIVFICVKPGDARARAT
jgi:pyrroline-5-carboxylate reductase